MICFCNIANPFLMGLDQSLETIGNDIFCHHCETLHSPVNNNAIEYGEKYFKKYIAYEQYAENAPLQKIRWDLIQKYRHYPCSVLDFGCGVGAFLSAKPERDTKILDAKGKELNPYFSEVYGKEINPFCIDYCRRNKGLKVHSQTYQPKVAFVTMFDVLEHFESALEGVEVAKSYLTAGGYIIISVPNFTKDRLKSISSWRHYRPGEHITYFSNKSMEFLAKAANLELIEVNYNESKVRTPDNNIATYVMRDYDRTFHQT